MSATAKRNPAGRRLIVNADDFGLSPGINAGIVQAHRDGILSSASILANAPFFGAAVAMAAGNPRLGVGLHLNLVRGRPLSPPEEIPGLIGADKRFRPFRLRRFSARILEQAEREYRRQFEKILAADCAPTHIDFEKHHAWQAPLYRLACRLAREYGVMAVRNLREPVAWSARRLGWPGVGRLIMASLLRAGVDLLGPDGRGLSRPDRLLGQTHIGGMDEAAWLRLARFLPEGTSEVMVHPGQAEESPNFHPGDMGGSWLGRARQRELTALLSSRVAAALRERGAELINYRGISEAD